METVEQLVSFNHVHVHLNGGAPWGFTLKGGLEHGEPLIITKIEEGGKADQCKKLRVGDELVNINGSALYGSRQEALILIKGSYRVLKIVVRRRAVPLSRPHSWYLAKPLEPVPAPAGSPDGPLAMQIHPTPFSVPWQSGADNSELSMQLGLFSRHYSTDHSSSVGSMESLENPPSQGYYDNQLSPIDPAIFNNKRDSAYSSFSASSNTSDYTVSLRPEENSSMDSLLQGLGPSGRFIEGRPHSAASGPGELHCEEGSLKARSLPHKPEVKIRPSSYSYEEQKCGPPQPPMRKDSFRATRGRPGVPDKRCVSAPVGIPSLTCCTIENPTRIHKVLNGNECLNESQENGQSLKESSTETYYTLSSQQELCIDSQARSAECQKNSHLQPLQRCSSRPNPPPEDGLDTQLTHLENNLQSRMYRHGAPEKLLASQLNMVETSSDISEHSVSPSSQWSNPLHPREDLGENSPAVISQGKWGGGSRCSTPGSVTTSELEEQRMEEEQLDSDQIVSPARHSWLRSVSVPGEPAKNGFCNSGPTMDSQLLERDFGPVSAAASMDTLLEENQERSEGRENESEVSKPSQKRQFRSSKCRRRSERFATNLRNEIQRKKAQLQKSKVTGGILCGEDTVEEEGGNLHMEKNSTLEPSRNHQPIAQNHTSHHTNLQNTAFAPSQARTCANLTFQQVLNKCDGTSGVEHSRTRTDTQLSEKETQLTEETRPVSEEASANNTRHWRWTPEHTLQREMQPNEKKNERTGPSSLNPGTTRGRVGSSNGRYSRGDDCDIPPFADRRKFFEETSRNLSQSVTNLASLTSRRQRPEKQQAKNEPSSPDPRESIPALGQRRFSYQGGVHDGTGISLETRRQFANVEQERDGEIIMEREREREKEKERQREQERLKDQERLQAWEKEQEEERERERTRKEAEGEKQRVQKMERERETSGDVMCGGHDLSNTITPLALPHDARPKQPLGSLSFIPSNSHPDNCHKTTNPDVPKPCSAFRPVTSQQYQSDQSCLHLGFKNRSCTPTEVYLVREQEQIKLNRKFSLTERDYALYQRDSTPGEVTVGLGFQRQWNDRRRIGNNEDGPFISSVLRNRAMSENDLREPQGLRSHTVLNAYASGMSSLTLRELDENIMTEAKKKKGPPPPRPPPPKWGRFHSRQTSHHNLFSAPPGAFPQAQSYGPCSSIVAEITRQRSYSLPPREGLESCQQCYRDLPVAPPSPAFTRRAFKPVALPPEERRMPVSHHDDANSVVDTLPTWTESNRRLSDQNLGSPSNQFKPAVVKPVFHKYTAEWDLTGLHNSTAAKSTSRSSYTPLTLENGSCPGPVPPESYFTMNHRNKQHLESQSQQMGFHGPAFKNSECVSQSPLPREEETQPLETDIDDFHETEDTVVEQHRQAESRTEMQCFAQPVTVLETDIDTLSAKDTPLVAMTKEQRPSMVESLLEEDYGRARKELMGELFPHCTEAGSGGEGWRGGYPVSGNTIERSSRQGTSSSSSAATNKTQLLNKLKDFSEMKEEDEELNYKTQLMDSLRKKLGVLRDAQRGLQEDIRANSQLGEEVESLVLAVCKPNEVDKFRMFIGDLDKVTSLLLSLSGRLLRVESALDRLDTESSHHERLPLLEKKKQLLVQLAEAQELKEHVDRREQAVGSVLARCLTPEQLRDYSHFVKMKAALLVEQRQLEDKIRLGEEQLRGLRESLGLVVGTSLGYGHY
ncbi:protein Shroom4 isoform X1 [Electrophorus electricus]|uniref:protein Shroom4 isoform X1 n=2 Tax=Electrophorus electricus TaxID=8005 RepID=UPI0015CFFB40|nr:protein Shroom4 isoform X1 [Electrophorus electricus]